MIRVAACMRFLHNERAEIVGATRMGHIMSLYLAVRRAHQSLESQLLLALPRGITSRQALILDLLLDRSAVDKQADIVAQIGIDRSTLADVMKRIAAPMVGGLFTSFLLELLVYPAVYLLWKRRNLAHEP